jgi:nucleoside-diphosphate-sugar epimerase
MSFFHSFDLPVAIARPFNTYGPRQSARAIIPTIITQLASGKKQIALGSLAPTRDLNYVADTCRGLLLIAASEKTVGETVNIGSGTETAMEDVFKLIREIMQIEAEAVLDTDRLRPDKSEVARLCCDNKKIHALTGFVPEVALRTGLESTIHWFMQGSGARRYKSQLYTV